MVDDEGEVSIRTLYVRVPADLHEAVRRHAEGRGLTLNAATIVLLRDALQAEERRAARRGKRKGESG